jgi:Protein of unknown function (DUF3164).
MGREVPAAYVQPWDKARDKTVLKILANFRAARARLEALMTKTLARLYTLIASREAETGAPLADRGNFSASSFDGLVKVEMKQQYRIALDDQARAAKALMLEYATGLVGSLDSGETKDVLMQFIESAFAANNTGTLPVAKIIQLKKLRITAPVWQQAIKLLDDAVISDRGKCYIIVSVRPDRQHDPETIRLDIADCWPQLDDGKTNPLPCDAP